MTFFDHKKSKFGFFAFLASSLYLAVVANPSAKPTLPYKFRYTGGLVDCGSYCEGNEIHARWIVDNGITSGVFKWQYRDTSIPDDTWHPLPDGRIEYGQHFQVVANAEHFEIMCWPVFDAGPTVVTNGVYHLSGVMHPMSGEDDIYLTPQTEIRSEFRLLHHLPTIPTELYRMFIERHIENKTETEEEK